jgi:hypothetical protein
MMADAACLCRWVGDVKAKLNRCALATLTARVNRFPTAPLMVLATRTHGVFENDSFAPVGAFAIRRSGFDSGTAQRLRWRRRRLCQPFHDAPTAGWIDHSGVERK